MKRLVCLWLVGALPLWAQTPEQGQFRGSDYAAVKLDPHLFRIDILTFGRSGRGWSERYGTLQDLPREWPVALNGTFFSLRTHQPAAVLVYDRGRQRWTPDYTRDYQGRPRAVVSLDRWFLAVSPSGDVVLDHSRGQNCDKVCRRLGWDPECLMGGGGLLVDGGRNVLSPSTLAQAGFDEQSGLRQDSPLPRTAVGWDGHKLLWVTARALTLGDMADLLVHLGSSRALFLDCGSSTAMRVGSWEVGQGRALPTWLVARRRQK